MTFNPVPHVSNSFGTSATEPCCSRGRLQTPQSSPRVFYHPIALWSLVLMQSSGQSWFGYYFSSMKSNCLLYIECSKLRMKRLSAPALRNHCRRQRGLHRRLHPGASSKSAIAHHVCQTRIFVCGHVLHQRQRQACGGLSGWVYICIQGAAQHRGLSRCKSASHYHVRSKPAAAACTLACAACVRTMRRL